MIARQIHADLPTVAKQFQEGAGRAMTARATRDPEAAVVARLSLLGPVRLIDGGGNDVTPRSAHRRALLGVVGLAGDTGISRVRLQDLFWGDKDSARAAQSLRTALHGLRRDTDDCRGAILEVTPTQVRLVPGAVRVDLLAFLKEGPAALAPHLLRDPPDLMEGLDLGAAEFEDWLRDHRVEWHCRITEARTAGLVNGVAGAIATSGQEDLRPVVGLLQPVFQSRSVEAAYLGEALLDRIATGLRDYVGARIVDFRDVEGISQQPVGPDIYLRFRLFEFGDAVVFRVLAHDRDSTELLWSVERGPIDRDRARLEHAEILGLMGEVIERVAATLDRRCASREGMPITPFHALTRMFELDHSSLGALRGELERAWDQTDATIYPALIAYLNSFRVGEHWHPGGTVLEDETRALVSQVQADRASGGLAYGLAGHAMGYVLHEHGAAGDMLNHALRLSPHSAVCWDHLALHCTYTGGYEHARVASENALRIGAHSPIEFTLKTTRSMIATLLGDFDTATDLGGRILTWRPNFGAALRYMSVGLAHQGDIERAKDCVRSIREMDPDFSVDWVRSDRMAVRDDAAKEILLTGLTKAGAT